MSRRLERAGSVALLSAGVLAFEIILVRVFAITHFHHFAYMAVGLAMLGFGVSGTLVAGLGAEASGTAERWWPRAAALTPPALVVGPALAHLIGVDATRLVWEPEHWLAAAAVSMVLAIPFAVGALAILLALLLSRERPGELYGASFVGAALGGAAALAALWLALPERALAAPALLAAPAAILAARGAWRWLSLAAAIGAVVWPPWRLTLTPYKGLPQVERYPGAQRVAERASPVGWAVAVRAAAFRHAPGLALEYRGAFPPQTALFLDGELVGAAADWDAEPRAAELFAWLPSAAAYTLGRPGRVLVVGAADGIETWSALAHGADHVTAVELSSDAAHLVRRFSSPSLAEDPRVVWVAGDARRLIARGDDRFDVVVLGPGSGFGAAAAGVHALSEDFLHTVEAYEEYLARLDRDGVLAVTRWVTVPPRASVRVILTAAEALRRRGARAAAAGMVVARGWGTTTVLLKPSGFRSDDVSRLREWAATRGFDVDWVPGLDAAPVGRHVLDDPVLFRAARAAAAGPDSAGAFARAYPFEVAPVTDARPYAHHFLRARSLTALVKRARGEWLPFAEWGYFALLATLGQSGVLATALLLVPVLRGARPGARVVVYFAAIGVGYLAAEIAIIQVVGFLLGHPLYGVTAALVALLAFSGLGSVASDRLPVQTGGRVTLVVAALLAGAAMLLLPLAHAFAAAGSAIRILVAALALAPLAVMMGGPFALGLRRLASGDPARTAWAWAANGFASVVTAPLAALIAVEWGSPVLLLVAAAAYALAGLPTVPLETSS